VTWPKSWVINAAVMIRTAAPYGYWFTSYPTPLAEVGVRAF
jgi:hypothetical protein